MKLNNIPVLLLYCVLVFLYSCSDSKSKTAEEEKKEEACISCNGKGNISCTTCNEKGTTDCSWCYGKGEKDCADCSSGRINKYVGYMYKDGYQLVNVPGYSGYIHVIAGNINAACQKCNGSGEIDCSNISCQSGKLECSWCYGKGHKTCLACSGTGKTN